MHNCYCGLRCFWQLSDELVDNNIEFYFLTLHNDIYQHSGFFFIKRMHSWLYPIKNKQKKKYTHGIDG